MISSDTKKIKRISIGFLFLTIINAGIWGVATLIWLATGWTAGRFANLTADEILFHMLVPLEGSDHEVIFSFIKSCFLPGAVVGTLIIVAYVVYRFVKYRRYLRTEDASLYNKRRAVMVHLLVMLTAIVFLVVGTYNFLTTFGFAEYIKDSTTNVDFIDENYVDPKNVKLTFPEQKRNLVFIFLESMEATFASRELGGMFDTDIIPELTALAQDEDSISFSHTDYPIGGSAAITGTTWTIASMVAHSAGIPLKLPISENSFGIYANFLPGCYSLGDVLKKEGYNQTLLIGSDAAFGGRLSYYYQHGRYDINDFFTAVKNGIITEDDWGFWGYEDQVLYQNAKDELLDLSSKDKPFNLTMLTVETHHLGGHVCSLCRDDYDISYLNVYACASRQLHDFISWIKEQDFYENTSIVIVGDHNSMDPLIEDLKEEDYLRTRYNAFINSSVSTENTRNRQYSPFDIYPSTLASMGVQIENERLALGVNLFSDEPTLMELYGYEEMDKGLMGRSLKYLSFF